MKPIKDRHLESPGEANGDKHINFLAKENGDTDPADETFDTDTDNSNSDTSKVDNGFFSDDEESATKPITKNHQHTSISSEKIVPVPADEAQVINDSVPEGDNNIAPGRGNKSKVSKTQNDDQTH